MKFGVDSHVSQQGTRVRTPSPGNQNWYSSIPAIVVLDATDADGDKREETIKGQGFWIVLSLCCIARSLPSFVNNGEPFHVDGRIFSSERTCEIFHVGYAANKNWSVVGQRGAGGFYPDLASSFPSASNSIWVVGRGIHCPFRCR